MKLISILIKLIILASCSSQKGFKIKNLNYEDTIIIDFVISYPNLKGQTKSSAKRLRAILLEAAISRAYTAIFRLGDYGLESYNPNDFGLARDSLHSYSVPFKYSRYLTHTLDYSYENLRGDNFGSLKELSSSYGTHTWRKPIAIDQNDFYIVTPRKLQKLIKTKIPILNRKEFRAAIRELYKNHTNKNVKQSFKSFLRSSFPEAKYHDPIGSTVESIFSKTQSFKDGMMIGSETLSSPNTVSYAVDKNHYALWGIMLLLNSELEVLENNKFTYKARIKIPIKKILKKYKYANMSDYIE